MLCVSEGSCPKDKAWKQEGGGDSGGGDVEGLTQMALRDVGDLAESGREDLMPAAAAGKISPACYPEFELFKQQFFKDHPGLLTTPTPLAPPPARADGGGGGGEGGSGSVGSALPSLANGGAGGVFLSVVTMLSVFSIIVILAIRLFQVSQPFFHHTHD